MCYTSIITKITIFCDVDDDLSGVSSEGTGIRPQPLLNITNTLHNYVLPKNLWASHLITPNFTMEGCSVS